MNQINTAISPFLPNLVMFLCFSENFLKQVKSNGELNILKAATRNFHQRSYPSLVNLSFDKKQQHTPPSPIDKSISNIKSLQIHIYIGPLPFLFHPTQFNRARE
jgi:hypothetical protein